MAAYSPERMGANYSRASEPHKSGRGGALLDSRGACTAQLVQPWRAGPGRERQAGAKGRGCAGTQCGVTPGVGGICPVGADCHGAALLRIESVGECVAAKGRSVGTHRGVVRHCAGAWRGVAWRGVGRRKSEGRGGEGL